MPEIIKVYRESLPSLRLIGKCYTNSDRGADGSFGNKWGEWFAKELFKPLEALGSLQENDNAYLGCMRCPGGLGDNFEYWIGMFFAENTPVPAGYEHADIPAGDIGVCWIYGRDDNGELYGAEPHNMCMSKVIEAGWQFENDPWFFERYNSPRFTMPDENGKVILDYGIYIKKAE